MVNQELIRYLKSQKNLKYSPWLWRKVRKIFGFPLKVKKLNIKHEFLPHQLQTCISKKDLDYVLSKVKKRQVPLLMTYISNYCATKQKQTLNIGNNYDPYRKKYFIPKTPNKVNALPNIPNLKLSQPTLQNVTMPAIKIPNEEQRRHIWNNNEQLIEWRRTLVLRKKIPYIYKFFFGISIAGMGIMGTIFALWGASFLFGIFPVGLVWNFMIYGVSRTLITAAGYGSLLTLMSTTKTGYAMITNIFGKLKDFVYNNNKYKMATESFGALQVANNSIKEWITSFEDLSENFKGKIDEIIDGLYKVVKIIKARIWTPIKNRIITPFISKLTSGILSTAMNLFFNNESSVIVRIKNFILATITKIKDKISITEYVVVNIHKNNKIQDFKTWHEFKEQFPMRAQIANKRKNIWTKIEQDMKNNDDFRFFMRCGLIEFQDKQQQFQNRIESLQPKTITNGTSMKTTCAQELKELEEFKKKIQNENFEKELDEKTFSMNSETQNDTRESN